MSSLPDAANTPALNAIFVDNLRRVSFDD